MGSQVSVTFELGVITNVHRNVDTDRMIPIRLNRNIKYQGGGEAFASSCPNVKLHAEIAYNTVAHTVSGCIVLYRPRHFFLKPIQLPAVCPAYVPAQPRPAPQVGARVTLLSRVHTLFRALTGWAGAEGFADACVCGSPRTAGGPLPALGPAPRKRMVGVGQRWARGACVAPVCR